MTIDLATPMLGPVDTTPALLIPAFSGNKYDDATVAAFAAALVKWAGVFGIRASILAGQIAHETRFFQFGGDVKPAQYNLAGLATTGGGVAGLSFPDIETGVMAVLAHHCTYIYGDVANWPDGLRQYQHLDQRYAAVLSTGRAGSVKLLQDYSNGNWAYSKQYPIGSLANGYAAGIASLANQFTSNPQPSPGGTMRLIISAGHEGIQNITSDPNGVINPAALRGGTGANGEMAWNAACADALTGLLRAAGVDAVRTDAIYHADVYGPDADLVIAIHYDGGSGSGHPQYAMGSAVVSGNSDDAADAKAQAFVDLWTPMYQSHFGFGQGPITVDMTQYYGGWYRTHATPFCLLEHCLGADASGIRADRPSPQDAAAADFAALAKHFNLTNNPQPPAPPPQKFEMDGHDVGEGFYNDLVRMGDNKARWFGVAVDDQHAGYLVEPANDAQRAKGLSAVAHPVVIVNGDRAPLIWDRGRTPPPWDVRIPLLVQDVVDSVDDPATLAILHAMELVNEPI